MMTYETYFSLIDKETRIVDMLLEGITQLNKNQINWRASGNSWSAGECFEHLLRMNEYYIIHFEKASGSTANNFNFQSKFKSTLGGKFVLVGVKPDQKFKAKTSRKYNPLNSDIDPGIVEKFLKQHEIIKSLIKKCRGADLNKIRIASPFTKLLKYNIGEAFMIIMLHDQRHILQAKKVIDNPNFPR